jgi:hypothetical protein
MPFLKFNELPSIFIDIKERSQKISSELKKLIVELKGESRDGGSQVPQILPFKIANVSP